MIKYDNQDAMREYNYWINYIQNSEHKIIYKKELGGYQVVAAPYSDFFVFFEKMSSPVDNPMGEGRIVFSKTIDKSASYCDSTRLYWHRLDGPACIEFHRGDYSFNFWICDTMVSSEVFNNDARVISHNLGKLINEVLDE